MNITITRPSDTTTRTDETLRPAAVALRASVAAVRDALAHMDDGAVLSVPIGTPRENFEIVEWCARNDKPVINRFDPWPLDHLIIRNQVPTPATDQPTNRTSTRSGSSPMTNTSAPSTDDTREVISPGVARRHSTPRRRTLRSLRRSSRRDQRPPGRITHPTMVAQAITPRSVGSL